MALAIGQRAQTARRHREERSDAAIQESRPRASALARASPRSATRLLANALRLRRSLRARPKRKRLRGVGSATPRKNGAVQKPSAPNGPWIAASLRSSR